MPRIPVSSRCFASAGYDDQSRTLEVEFHRGDVYEVLDLEPEYADEFRAEEERADGSMGGYFNRVIRKLGKTIRKVSGGHGDAVAA